MGLTEGAHTPRTAVAVGRWLGIAFAVCFLTGLWSHVVQRWGNAPASPAWGYRLTQGVHVVTGLACVPLLLAKLWVVYPRLFQWPPVRSVAHGIERLSIGLLVGSALFEVTTGVLNIAQWYPWPFYFPAAHYAVAWVAVGALCLHLSAKWTVIRTAPSTVDPDPVRRRVLGTALGSAAAVALLTAGQAFRPLRAIAVLAPRRPDVGPQGLPVNRTAAQARIAVDPAYKLVVAGPRRVVLSLAELSALPQRTVSLPIACVEGWSVGARWTGVPLRDLLELASVPAGATVRVVSLERGGLYRSSLVGPRQARHPDTLVALRLHGEPLAPDHGYPARLIAPNRPGVQQTKWLSTIEVV